jgi:voltage-gated potassium channel
VHRCIVTASESANSTRDGLFILPRDTVIIEAMRKDNFIYMLLALIVFLVILPIFQELQILPEDIARPIAYTCLLAVGVWSLRDRVRTFRIGMALVLIGTITNILTAAKDHSVFYYLSVVTMSAFLILSIWSALRQVVLGTEINANRLFGAVCIYKMIGVLWALMYGVLQTLDVNAFSGETHGESGDWGPTWIYYSFVTLTTLGYGDILPISTTARTLAYTEAVIGVFYLAMLVAALVGSYAAANKDRIQ